MLSSSFNANEHEARLALEILPLLSLHFLPLQPGMPPPRSCLKYLSASHHVLRSIIWGTFRANLIIVRDAFMDRTLVEMVFAKTRPAETLGAFRAISVGIDKFMKRRDRPTMVWSLRSSPQFDPKPLVAPLFLLPSSLQSLFLEGTGPSLAKVALMLDVSI